MDHNWMISKSKINSTLLITSTIDHTGYLKQMGH